MCVQASNPHDPDNYSVFVVNYYPPTEGITWKPDTQRITAHTDETLVTLLFTSPGVLLCRNLLASCFAWPRLAGGGINTEHRAHG